MEGCAPPYGLVTRHYPRLTYETWNNKKCLTCDLVEVNLTAQSCAVREGFPMMTISLNPIEKTWDSIMQHTLRHFLDTLSQMLLRSAQLRLCGKTPWLEKSCWLSSRSVNLHRQKLVMTHSLIPSILTSKYDCGLRMVEWLCQCIASDKVNIMWPEGPNIRPGSLH